jgi:hypothetical protein
MIKKKTMTMFKSAHKQGKINQAGSRLNRKRRIFSLFFSRNPKKQSAKRKSTILDINVSFSTSI